MNPIDAVMELLASAFSQAQQWLFEQVMVPVLFHAGLGNLLEDGYRASLWLLVGLIQIAVLLVVIGPLQRWRPVEPAQEARAVRVDVIYTLIHRLGLFRLALFFGVEPFWNALWGQLSLWGWRPWHLDAALAGLWPGVTDGALVAFLAYLVLFDLLDYFFHRAQHRYRWWWALHAVHHSQRSMSMWTDNRNHLLDDLLRDSLFVIAARCVGVAPGQFVALVAVTQLIESLSHANVRLAFGRVFERVLVSPRFHRLHHAIGIGHESAGAGSLGGHNFAVLFPVWDVLFRTASFEARDEPTGIRDQLPGPTGSLGRDYGRGFWAQQRLAVLRMVGRDRLT
jgi:sterol desaturase/sphingolipid hydroxylase (fatty acid hydroxylase superfamily)